MIGEQSQNYRQRTVIHLLSVLSVCTDSVCSQCSSNYANLTATESYHEFTSPGYPADYGPDLDCGWYIKTENSSHVVKLEFLEFATEDSGYCFEDYIRVYDGEPQWSTYLAKYCGRKKPDPIVSTDVLITIYFITDSLKETTGFRARYISGPDSSFYDYDYYSDESETSSVSLYIIMGATVGSLLAVAIATVVSVKVYQHIIAKKATNIRPQGRLSLARVYPQESQHSHDNRYQDNNVRHDLPPAYSDIHVRPMSPPPRYSLFDTNTTR